MSRSAFAVIAVVAVVASRATHQVLRRWRRRRPVPDSWLSAKGNIDFTYVQRAKRRYVLCVGYSYPVSGMFLYGTFESEFAIKSRAHSYCEYIKSIPLVIRYKPSRPGVSRLVPGRRAEEPGLALAISPVELPLIDILMDFSPGAAVTWGAALLCFGVANHRSGLRRCWTHRVSASWPKAEAILESSEVDDEGRRCR